METTTTHLTACDGICGKSHPTDEMRHYNEGASICEACEFAHEVEMAAACGSPIVGYVATDTAPRVAVKVTIHNVDRFGVHTVRTPAGIVRKMNRGHVFSTPGEVETAIAHHAAIAAMCDQYRGGAPFSGRTWQGD